jgi:hypothetical protein
MSAQHNRKCDRVDRRMAEAKQLLEMWATNTLDSRFYVTRRAMASSRRLAAIVLAARTPKQRQAANEICERIARERTS